MLNNTQAKLEKQDATRQLEIKLYRLLEPLLRSMNEQADRRVVKTLLGLVMAILMHRHRNHGLLMSELGGYLLGAERCRAGSKRIGEKSPYDRDWLYWGARLSRTPIYPKQKTTLLKRQQGKCPHCGLRFIDGNVCKRHICRSASLQW